MKQLLFSFSGACCICFFGILFPKNHVPLVNLTITPLPAVADSTYTIKLVFAGDIMGHEPQFLAALQPDKTYDYHDNYRYVKEYVSSADLAVANLEVTLAGPPYSGYPMFSSPDALAIAVKDAGFDVLQTSNNHSCDKGLKGIRRTLDVLDSLGIEHFGTYRNVQESDAYHPFIKNVKGIKIAMLNYTYGTNGMPIPTGAVVNVIDTAVIKKDLEKAKNSHVDFIIVTFHWGIEYQRTESADQRKVAEFTAKHGADLIIGGHPHVVQPIKKIKGATDSIWTVYSLGNYISNQRDRYKNGGIMTEITLTRSCTGTYLKDIKYVPVWVYKKSSPKVFYTLIPGYMDSIIAKDTLIKMSTADKFLMNQFFQDTRKHLATIQESNLN